MKLIEVVRISIPQRDPSGRIYREAAEDVRQAIGQGYTVTAEGQDIVIRRPADAQGVAA
jgi:hypothetical protein